jgi:multidrug efflux system membrane fusion protein
MRKLFFSKLFISNFLIFAMVLFPILQAHAAGIPVVIAKVAEQGSGELIRIKTTTHPVQQADITPSIAGVVKEIYFQSGQKIQKGSTLFKLEDSVAKAQLNKAQALFHYHDLNLTKYKQLFKSHAVSQMEVQRLQAERDQSLAAVQELQANLNLYTVKAPFDGQLGLSHIAVGQYVVPGTSVLHISDTTKLWVDFPVPEKYIQDVKKLKHVQIMPDGKNQAAFTANIIAEDDRFINNTHSLKVRAVIDNPSKALSPGSFVSVSFSAQNQEKLLSIPATALVFNANGTFVYTLKNNAAHLQPVVLSHVSDDVAFIRKGLVLNEPVVITGQINLQEGAPVQVTTPAQKA